MRGLYYWGAGPDDVFGRAGAAIAYEIRISQGVKEFLKSNLTGTGVLLSGEFIILRSGQTTIPRTITIPRYEQTFRMPRSRQTITITIAEQTITIPN